MTTTNEYIIFEADQVLTNGHLNQLFNYLDSQNRWTRNKFIGAGIECGLVLSYDPVAVTISVSGGTGLTSQGYLILRNDIDIYAYYIPYTGPDISAIELPFNYPDKLPFYNNYTAENPVYRLLTKKEQADLITADEDSGKPLTDIKASLGDYVVVLFLEMIEKDLKNCDTFDCNNKGEKMMFNLRTLLVPKKAAPAYPKPWSIKPVEINLKRYNVPNNPIQSSKDVLDNFFQIVEDANLPENLALAYNHCSEIYNTYIIKNNSANADNSFQNLAADLRYLHASIKKTKPVIVQYYYDFINDLLLSYREFSHKAKEIVSVCCLDENAFALHLVLGIANTSTGNLHNDLNRQYFIHTPLHDQQNTYLDELRLLYERAKSMVVYFTLWVKQIVIGESEIKITPSQYQSSPLSARSIPYYYHEPGKTNCNIYTFWNFHKTRYGNEQNNLGYNSPDYSTNNATTNPLLFDIEYYNFFRIEGHIGMAYAAAHETLISLRNTYNLPVDIVAVSAEMLSNPSENMPECQIQDLATDYWLIVSDILCRLFECIHPYLKLKYNASVPSATWNIAKEVAIVDERGTEKIASPGAPVQEASANDFEKDYRPVDFLAIQKGSYQKGDFILKYYMSNNDDTTLGNTYIASINNGIYSNPLYKAAININDNYFQLTQMAFDLINASDNIYMYLLNNDITSFDSQVFNGIYEIYKDLQQKIDDYLNSANSAAKTTPLKDNTENCACNDLICLIEKISLLMQEYKRRVKMYEDQLKFMNYYQKHPGLEHKAGVPKGGTFVLVYSLKDELQLPEKVVEQYKGLFDFSQKIAGLDSATGTKYSVKNAASDLDQTVRKAVSTFIGKMYDASPAERKSIDQFLGNNKTDTLAYNIQPGTVIADFYIPYQCCSDCAPIAYVLGAKINVYAVTGGGGYCDGSTGVSIGLNGSDKGIDYQLYKDTTAVGTTIPGTGAALNFGLITPAGTYKIVAINSVTNEHTNMAGTTTVTVNPMPAAINGPTALCTGTKITLTDSTAGGKWSSADSNIATVDPDTGVVSGKTAGTVLISYTLPAGCAVTKSITVNPMPADITGATSVCQGAQITLTDATPGGKWSSSDPKIATVDAATGVVTAKTAGTVIITYTMPGGCMVTKSITVNPMPADISGPTTMCLASTITLADTTTGGAWSSSDTKIATVDAATGVVTAKSVGTVIITYKMPGGCMVTKSITVNPMPADITGPTTICQSSTITLADTTTGGVWSSSDPKIATVDAATGVVTAKSVGTVIITYKMPGGCMVTKSITVNPIPADITGPTTMCQSSTITLADTTTGGVWSSSDTKIATVDAATGVVTAKSVGTVIIIYKMPGGCMVTKSITVNPMPADITGPTTICQSSTITLADTTTGGVWSSSDPKIATVDAATGVVTAKSVGTVIITYKMPGGCMVTKSITVNPIPADITGPTTICQSSTITLADTTTGGVWSSSDTKIATVDAATGVVTAKSVGTVIITYKMPGGCMVTKSITVNPMPADITGPTTICQSSTITLADTTTGGVWSSSDTKIATVDAATGVVTAKSVGTVIITYKMPGGCMVTKSITVNPMPAVITGVSAICTGSSIQLTNTITGGTWSSSDPSIASVDPASGIATGKTVGTATITYTMPGGCSVSKSITVNKTPTSIIGASVICQGMETTLSNSVSGGTWSSSNPAIASIDPVTGLLLAKAPGTVVITYTMPGSCSVNKSVTVNPKPADIIGQPGIYVGQTTQFSDSTAGGTWSSSDTTIATVDSSGVVTGKKQGSATITYTLTATGCKVSKDIIIMSRQSGGGAPGGIPITGTTTTGGNITGPNN